MVVTAPLAIHENLAAAEALSAAGARVMRTRGADTLAGAAGPGANADSERTGGAGETMDEVRPAGSGWGAGEVGGAGGGAAAGGGGAGDGGGWGAGASDDASSCEPKSWVHSSLPLALAATPTPIARKPARSMFARWPAEESQACITDWGVVCPSAMFSPHALVVAGYPQAASRSSTLRETGGAGSSCARYE